VPVAKRRIEIGELFDLYLKFTPTPGQIDEIRADLQRLHPTLLHDAAKEAREGNALKGLGTNEFRPAIHGIYTRKLKELASLYPFIFTLENAMRARIAEEMEHLTHTKTWWRPVLAELRAGRDPKRLSQLGALAATGGFLRRIADMVCWIEGEKLSRARLASIDDGLSFLCETTFGQLRYLVLEGWVHFEKIFRPSNAPGLKKLTRTELENSSKIVLDARNELHHHNPIRERQKVVTACESILDYLNLHLGSLDQDLRSQSYPRPNFSVAVAHRHRVCRS
jgi:hypothetical protein